MSVGRNENPLEGIFGPDKLAARVPFPIRAHHLEKYADASPNGKPFKMILIGNAYLPIRDSVDATIDYIKNTSDQEYRKDVFGADENPATFGARFRAATTLFYSLPEDYPVFVSAEKDVICNSCVIGNHCEQSSFEGINQEVASIRLLADAMALANAVEKGDMQLAFQIVAVRQRNSRTGLISAIQTDAGTLKKAFKSMEHLRQVDLGRLRSGNFY